MDDTRIFRKTPAGEEAVRDRAQLSRRDLRTMLIIVDGHADVAELKRKTGDAALVEAALPELEGMGLIDAVGMSGAQAEEAAPSGEIMDIFGEFAAAAGEEMPLAEQAPARARVVPGFVEPMEPVPAVAKRNEVPEPAAAPVKRERAEKAVAVVPTRRRLRLGLPLVVGAAAGVTLILLLVVVFYPYDSHRPEIERRMSLALQDTVRVGKADVRFTPLPTIVLAQVTVGDPGYASAAAVRLSPELGSLFGERKRLREVRAEGVRLRQAGVARAMRWLPAATVRELPVGRVVLEDVTLDFDKAALEGLSGEGVIDPTHGLVKWSLRNKEGTVLAEAAPAKAGVRLAVSAASWRMPFRPALLFDALAVDGDLSTGVFRFDKLDGRLYDGLIEGAGVLAWGDAARFGADVKLTRLAADRLLAALSAPPLLEGTASGRLRLDAQAPTPAGLASAVRMTGSFGVAKGALRRFDLAEALRVSGPLRGGETRFEDFTGGFAADGQGVRLTDLRLASGLMQASGQAAVGLAGDIGGAVVVEMKGAAGDRRAAFAVGGKADDPEIRPGRPPASVSP